MEAIATASITGRVRLKSPVISTTLASEVSGARAAAVNTAPIATTAYSTDSRGRPEELMHDVAGGHAGGHADLADRYLDHAHIDQYRQVQHHQRSGRALGWPALPAGTMKKLKKEHDRLIGRYGRDYREDYGWAAGLIQPPLTFAGLEAKADMNYLRYLYVTGSHLIHASAHGMTLTGPKETGLAQPAQASLNALIAVTGALIEHGPLGVPWPSQRSTATRLGPCRRVAAARWLTGAVLAHRP
ncbi:MAG TPA: DUF5677 domain-containing protein [Trebonia sp.]